MKIFKMLAIVVIALMLWSAGTPGSFERTVFARPACAVSDQVIAHKDYALSFSEEYKQAKWVAYKVQSKRAFNFNKNTKRTLRNDPLLNNSAASKMTHCEYSGLVAAKLFPTEFAPTVKSEKESCYISNISPQFEGFHKNVWLKLNNLIKSWADQGNEVYVITAGILSNNLLKISAEGWAVPDYFYKVVLSKKGNDLKMIGFLLPHYNSNAPISSYVTDVNYIEHLAGIDFFPELPDDVEETLESEIKPEEWDFPDLGKKNAFQIAQK